MGPILEKARFAPVAFAVCGGFLLACPYTAPLPNSTTQVEPPLPHLQVDQTLVEGIRCAASKPAVVRAMPAHGEEVGTIPHGLSLAPEPFDPSFYFEPSRRSLAYRASKGDKRVVVIGESVGTEFDEIAYLRMNVDGRVAYAARRGGLWRVVKDDEELSEFDAVGPPVFCEEPSQVAYFALKEGRWRVMRDRTQLHVLPSGSIPGHRELGRGYTPSDFVPDGPRQTSDGLLAFHATRSTGHIDTSLSVPRSESLVVGASLYRLTITGSWTGVNLQWGVMRSGVPTFIAGAQARTYHPNEEPPSLPSKQPLPFNKFDFVFEGSIPKAAHFKLGALEVSPGGTRYGYELGLDMGTSKVVIDGSNRGSGAYGITFSPDDSAVAWVEADPGALGSRRVVTNGSASEQFRAVYSVAGANSNDSRVVWFSEDGATAFFLARTDRSYVIVRNSPEGWSKEPFLGRHQSGVLLSPAPSGDDLAYVARPRAPLPDKGSVVVVSRNPSVEFLADPETAKVLGHHDEVASLTWTPTGSFGYLALDERSFRWNLSPPPP